MTANVKELAGRRAADMVKDGMRLGLGTGSTVWFTLVRLAERVREEGLSFRGVPTSLDTHQKARELGLMVAGLEELSELDLAIDGADEVDPAFHMVKGGGGALLREKVVASVAERVIIVVGENKVVDRLGSTFRLPIEVVPFARPIVERRLASLSLRPELRMLEEEHPYLTDNGNEILDCTAGEECTELGIADPPALEEKLRTIPGIVETGLFINLCHTLVIGNEDGTLDVREK